MCECMYSVCSAVGAEVQKRCAEIRIAVLLCNIYTLYQSSSSQGPPVGGAELDIERWQEAWLLSPSAVTSSSTITPDTV